MLIRIGFEMVFEVPAPAPMLLMLGLRPEREASIRRPGGPAVESEVPVGWYTDGFGNRCRRLLAPAGRLMLWDDLIVEDSGLPDPVATDAKQVPVQDLASRRPGVPAPSRYCEVDRLSDIAWASSEARPRAGRGSRRSAIGCTTTSGSATSSPGRPRRLMTSTRSGPVSAATSPTWR